MKLAKTIVFSMVLVLLLLLSPPAGLAIDNPYSVFVTDDNQIGITRPNAGIWATIDFYMDGDTSGGPFLSKYYDTNDTTVKVSLPLEHWYIYYMCDWYSNSGGNYSGSVSLKKPYGANNFKIEDVKWYGTANVSWYDANWPKDQLSWILDINGFDGEGYTYRRNLEFPSNEIDRNVVITSLPHEGKVTFSMYAKRGGLVSEKKEKTIYIPMMPLSGLTGACTSINPPNIELRWQPGDNNRQDAVEIERTNPDGSKTTIINEYYDDNWVDDQNSGHIEAGKTYKYRIRAISKSDAGYNSAWSDQITVSTMKLNPEIFQQAAAALMAPSGLQATAKSNNRIDLTWVYSSSAETGFAIERFGPDSSLAALVAPQDATSYSDTGLLPGSTYTYRVKAVKGTESSAYSISDSATTFQLTSSPSVIQVMVNGKLLSLDVNPVVVGGRTLVPLRGIFEALGASVEWNSGERKITARQGDITILLQIGSKQAFVDGKAVALDVAPDVIGGRTMVPMRFVSEAMGGNVNWDGGSRIASIISVPKTPLDPSKTPTLKKPGTLTPTPSTLPGITPGTLPEVPSGTQTQTQTPSLLPGTTPSTLPEVTNPAPQLPVLPVTYDLSLEPGSITISSTEYVEFSGTLESSFGGSSTQTGLSGKTITLYKVASGQRTKVGTATTGSGGYFSYKYKPSGSGTFLAVYKNSSGEELAASNNSVVTVKTVNTIPRIPVRIIP